MTRQHENVSARLKEKAPALVWGGFTHRKACALQSWFFFSESVLDQRCMAFYKTAINEQLFLLFLNWWGFSFSFFFFFENMIQLWWFSFSCLFLHLSLLTLFSSCWSTLCQLESLFPLAVILLCLHLSDKTCPTSYITRSYSAIYLLILPVAIQHIPVSQDFNMFYCRTHTPHLNSSSAVPWIEWKLYDVIWKIIFPVKSPLCRCNTDQV